MSRLISFVSIGVVLIAGLVCPMSESAAIESTADVLVVAQGAYNDVYLLDTLIRSVGLIPEFQTSLPADLSPYRLLILTKQDVANPGIITQLRDFIYNGGGFITTGGIPLYLAGSTNLSIISDFLGAMYYQNSNGMSVMVIDDPMCGSLPAGTVLFHDNLNPCNYGASVDGLLPGATAIAEWQGCTPYTTAFIHEYGAGRVYYSQTIYDYPSFGRPEMRELTLSAIRWTADACQSIQICDAFVTPNRIAVDGTIFDRRAPRNDDIRPQRDHLFMFHLESCEPTDVTIGDPALVYVDLDGDGDFEPEEQHSAKVVNVEFDGEIDEIVIKVLPGLYLLDNDPYVAIYTINDVPVVDAAGNPIDYLHLNTHTPGRSTIIAGDDECFSVPQEFALLANYPNPFNPVTTIEFGIPTDGHVTLEVFNILGGRVNVLVDEFLASGWHSYIWNADDNHGRQTASGTYFYRLTTNRETMTRKMVLLR